MVRRILKAIAVLAVLAILLVQNSRAVLVSADGPFTFFPSYALPNDVTNDGRFLTIDGNGLATLAGQETSVEFAVPPGTTSFQIGIFDGDSGRDSAGALNPAGGNWDIGTSATLFTLHFDPDVVADETNTVAQWSSTNPSIPLAGPLWSTSQPFMPNNDWWNVTVNTTDAAKAANGYYYYHMAITMPDVSSTSSNAFKLRTTGSMAVMPDTTFGFKGAMPVSSNDRKIIYPAYVTPFPSIDFLLTTPTTYDGHWTYYLSVPFGVTSLPLWDGDFDRGTIPTEGRTFPSDLPLQQCSHVGQPGVPAFPPFPSPAALPYGSAGTHPGSPADDNHRDVFRRSPCVYWTITDPNATVYTQGDPSGNQDWERFTVNTGSPLPTGTWKVDIYGLDLENLVFLHFPAGTCGLTASGASACPPLFGSIGDRVWNDLNANGIQDANEPGIQGVTVNLLDGNGNVIATMLTNATGNYLFPNLQAGNYKVQFVAPGYSFTTKNAAGSTTANDSNANTGTGTSDVIVLPVGFNDLTIDAGLYQPASLGNFVWNDTNFNGIQDGGEPGIANVTVNLLDSSGTPIPGKTTTTDANGFYSFANLVPGTYGVQFVAPSGYLFTTSNVGSNDAIDSDANTSTGKTGNVTLAAGDNNTTLDAGMYQASLANLSIGDRVWLDANGNGIQDVGELGIGGVTVKLLAADGTTVLETKTTDGNGNYLFTGLLPGTYYVQFEAPTGYVYTTKNAPGSTAANDSNANTTGVIGKTDPIILSGQNNLTIDAGLKKTVECGTNLCALIRSPGFWKNYDNHMSTAEFEALLKVTAHYSNLNAVGALAILNNNSDQFHRHLLSAELNAIWNGNQTDPLPTGPFGSGIYYKAGSSLNGKTVNEILALAFAATSPSDDLKDAVLYLGAGGETDGWSTCRVQVPQCPAPPTSTPKPPTATSTPKPPTATKTATNTPKPPTATNTPKPPTATNTPKPPTATKTVSSPGTGTPGYWMNHPEAWPFNTITIGGTAYSKTDAINFMKQSTSGDMTFQMFQHLVSAKLNVAIGNNATCISAQISAADVWMTTNPLGSNVAASSSAWQSISATFTQLDNYNNGLLCAPHRN